MEMQPAGVNVRRCPSFLFQGDSPAIKLPQAPAHSQWASLPVLAVPGLLQLPAVEFVAPVALAPAKHQAIHEGLAVSIAQAQSAPPGLEGKHPGHRRPGILRLIVRAMEAIAEQQQAATFRINRQAGPGCRRQIAQAAAGFSQLLAVQFRVAPRQHHPATAGRQRLIGQGTPWHDGGARCFQQLFGFGVEEMEGGIPGHGKRQGGMAPLERWGLGVWLGLPGFCCGSRGLEQGAPTGQIEVGSGEFGPGLLSLRQVLHFIGGQQPQVP